MPEEVPVPGVTFICSTCHRVFLLREAAIHCTHSADVAQSEEPLSRKQEDVGSTPTISSTGFSEEQRNIMSTIIHNRVKYEDSRISVKDSMRELVQLESEHNSKKLAIKLKINAAEKKMDIHLKAMLDHEDQLKRSIAESLIISPNVAVVEEPPVEEDSREEDLGRAE